MAVEAARALQPPLEHGAWFVALDGLDSPALVAPTAATALGLLDVSGVSAVQRLVQFVAQRQLLLVLDNFEHVTAAAPLISDLLQAAPGLRVLVTSRRPLHIAAEQNVPIAPLALPADGTDVESVLRQSDAVRLFLERARLGRPSFDLSPANSTDVVDICRRLDGLPLGIELAASRVRYFAPSLIVERLCRELDLPGPGLRDLPERQQTLERVVAWSYDLLEPVHQQLLARLSVFAGGCAVAEAEAVSRIADSADVLDGLAALVDQNLLVHEDGEAGSRYRMLETIRAYAHRRLAQSGELHDTRRRHALAYRDLAESAAAHLPGRHQLAWLDRLSADHDNLRAAVRWAVETGDAQTGLRLGAALWRFWQIRGHVAEGRRALALILAMDDAGEPSHHRVWALAAAGGLSWWANEVQLADGHYAAQLQLARELGDMAGVADALFNRAWPQVAMRGETGLEGVPNLLDESAAVYAQLGDGRALARVDNVRAFLLVARGELDQATEVLLDAVRRHEQFEDDFYADIAADSLAAAYMARGDVPTALHWQVRSLRSAGAMGNITAATFALTPLFVQLFQAGMVAEAATVDAAYEALRRRYGVDVPIRGERLAMTTAARDGLTQALSGAAYARALDRGSSMSLEDVVTFASEVVAARERGEATVNPMIPPSPASGSGRPADRLVREGDVWAITFEGRTFRLRDARGLRHLARLLAAAGREIPAIDLAAADFGGQSGASSAEVGQAGLAAASQGGEVLVDAQARVAYKARLIELKEDIDEADRHRDTERARSSRDEFEFLARELAAASGLGGRPREAGSAAERARISVAKAIHNTIARLKAHDQPLHAHLERSVRTGRMCSYRPDPGLGITWIVKPWSSPGAAAPPRSGRAAP